MVRYLRSLSLLISLGLAFPHGGSPVAATEKLSSTLAAMLQLPGAASAAANAATVVVGVPGGQAAYVYERNLGGANHWGQSRTFRPSDANDDEFGWSVAISGDTIAVGDDFGGRYGEGAVYIFERNRGGAGMWGRTVRIPAPEVSFLGGFGWSVALSGDTLVVGTSILDTAYVLSRNKGGTNKWGVVRKLSGPPDSFFGASVAVSGDLALVGSEKDVAYLYNRTQGGSNAWGLVKTFVRPTSYDFSFGKSVAVAGTTVAIGAPLSTPTIGPGFDTSAAGSVFVYGRNQGGPAVWGLVKQLISPDFYRARNFGSSLAMSGDVIVAGSPPEFQNGSACFFSRAWGGTNAWGAFALWQSTNNGTFGRFAAVGGDTAVVGQDGTAFVFRINP
jgi:FG-GAP repeat